MKIDDKKINNKKIALFFPGIGYNLDKPLMYYSRKTASVLGYEIMTLGYDKLPNNVKGNPRAMYEAAVMAYSQVCSQLENISFEEYERVVFIGKSIGTVVAARYISEKHIPASLVAYTPVEATADFDITDMLVFLGESDPWSDVDSLKNRIEEKNIPIHMYANANHSLETGDVMTDIAYLNDVMAKTEKFLSDNT